MGSASEKEGQNEARTDEELARLHSPSEVASDVSGSYDPGLPLGSRLARPLRYRRWQRC